jgi:hypothetical protein
MSTQTVVDVIVSGTTTTVVDKRVDGVTTVAGEPPVTNVSGQVPDLGVDTDILATEGDILSLTNDVANLRANLIVTGTTLTDEIGALSGVLISTGNQLDFTISTLSGELIASGNQLDSLRDILSGNLITTGATLKNEIDDNFALIDDLRTATGRLQYYKVERTGVSMSGNIVPSESGTLSIGTPEYPFSSGHFKDLKVSNNTLFVGDVPVKSSNGGVDFTSATGTAKFKDVSIRNLTVTGTEIIVDVENLAVKDNTILINSGESGAGITLVTGGLIIDRGSLENADFLFNEDNTRFEVNFPLAIDGSPAVKQNETGIFAANVDLKATGINLLNQIESNDSDISSLTSNLTSTGQTLTNNLIASGNFLNSEISTVSGLATGRTDLSQLSGDVDTLSGHLITTGQTLQTQITSNDNNITSLDSAIKATGLNLQNQITSNDSNISNINSNLGTTGQTLQTQITNNDRDISSLSGDVTSNLSQTGQFLTTEISIVSGIAGGSAFSELSGNLITTGQILTTDILTVSGLISGGEAIDTVSGLLIETGQYLTSEIGTVSGLVTSNDTEIASLLAATGELKTGVDNNISNLATTGQTLQTQILGNDSDIAGLDTRISQNVSDISTISTNLAATGQTLTTNINTVSVNLISTGNLLDANIATVSGIASAKTDVTELSGDVNTLSGNLITTGQTLQVQITSNDSDISILQTATGSLKTDINNNSLNTTSLSGTLNSTGQLLTDNLISTGNYLDAEIAIVSGLTTGSSSDPALSGKVDTLSGNLITTGQTLTTNINTVSSNLIATGKTLTDNINTVSSNLVSTGSRVDDISGNLITTGQTLQTQITSNDSDITNLTSNLITTGQTLTTDVNTVSGLITDNDADITALKSATGVLKTSTDNNTANLITTGSVIDDVSGNLITTGQTLQTQITSNDSDISNITSNLVTTGQTLQTQITSNDSDISTLTSNLITTGQTLTSEIGVVSGLTVTNLNNLVSTGKVIDDVSGNLITTGQTLQTQITSNDGDITTLTSNLVTTGQTLTTNINTVATNLGTSGQTLQTQITSNDSDISTLTSNLGTTGQTLQTQITSNDSDIASLTTNLGTTGQTLQTQITSNDSDISTLDSTTVKLTTNQSIAGNKIFTNDVTINNLTVTGTEVVVDVENLAVKDNIIEINSGESGAGISRISGGIVIDRGTATDANILYNDANDRFELNFPLAVEGEVVASASNLITTGQTLTTNINTVSTNLGTSGQTLQTQITSNDSDISTLTTNLGTTGQTLQTQITSNDSDISTLTTNLGTSGQTLQTQITSNDSDISTLTTNIGTTGQTLQTQITSNDSDISTLTSNLVTTGQTLTTNINTVSTNLGTSGQTLQTQITSNDTDITNLSSNLVTTGQTLTTNINTVATNLVTTGQTLTSEIATVSGLIPATVIDGGGTANKVPLWSDANTIGDSVISQSSSKIGIGTAAPTSPLTIKSSSTSATDSGLTIQGNSNTNAIVKIAEKSTDGARLHLYDGGVEKIAFYTDGTANHISAGSVGIGTNAPAGKLEIVGSNGTVTGTPDGDAEELVIRNNDRAGIQILSANNAYGSLIFGSASDINGANIFYAPAAKLLTIGTQVAAGEIALRAANGAEAVRIDADGNVGIGTNAPISKLQVQGGTVGMHVTDTYATSSGSLNLAYNDASDYGKIQAADSVAYRALLLNPSGGSVGIGTNSPDGTLHVHTASAGSVTPPTAADDLVIENSAACGITIISPDANDGGLYFANPSDGEAACLRWNHNADTLILETRNAGASLVFETANTVEAMRINSSGLVGIGTDAPSEMLHINKSSGTGSFIRFQDTGGGGVYIGARSNVMELYAGGAERMRIASDGKVGIGTNAPTTDLEVYKSSGAVQIYANSNSIIARLAVTGAGLGAVGTSSNADFVIQRNGTTKITVASALTTFADLLSLTTNSSGYALKIFENSGGEYFQLGVNQYGGLEIYNETTKCAEWYDTGDFKIPDNIKILLGTGDDLQIYHDGSNSYINDAGTGRLILKTSYFEVDNAAGNQAVIEGIESGAVNLFYSGSKKFETTNTGATVSGGLTVNDSDGRSTVTLIGAKTSDGNFADIYGSNNSGTGQAQMSFRRDGANDAAAILFYTEATGASLTEKVRINSAGCVGIGTASPADTLHVYGAGTTAIFESSSASSYVSIKEASGGNHVYLGNQSGLFIIQTPGSSYSTKFQVTSAGLVGIGVSPTTRLQVKDSVDNSYESGISIVRSADGATTWLNVRGGATNFNNKNNAGNAGLPYIWFQNGTERLKIESSGAVTFNNAFTFPTADGSAGQVLQTNGSGTVTWATVSGGGGISGSGTDHYIPRWNGTTALQDSAIIALDSGSVGIGTATPSRPLEVIGTGNASVIRVGDGDSDGSAGTSYIEFGANATSWNRQAYIGPASPSNSHLWIVNEENADILFYTNNDHKMVIKNDGKVGIGLTDPDAKLEIKGAGGGTGLTLKTTDSSSNNTFWIQDGGKAGLHYYPFVINQDNSDTDCPASTFFYVHHATAPFIIKNDGKVGIGTNAPAYALDVRSAGATTLQVKSASNSDDTQLKLQSNAFFFNITNEGASGNITYVSDDAQDQIWYTDNASNASVERFRIEGGADVDAIYFSNSKVGIGTNAPVQPLHVLGDAMRFERANNAVALQLYNNNASPADGAPLGYLQFMGKDNDGTASIVHSEVRGGVGYNTDTAVSGYLAFLTTNNGTSVAERMRIKYDGNVGIGTDNPGQLLHVYKAGVLEPNFQSTTGRVGLQLNAGAAGDVSWILYSGYPAAGDFNIRESGVANHFVIKKTTGSVGIGTNNPDVKLSVRDSTADLQMRIGSLTAGRDAKIRLQGKNTANSANRYADIGLDAENGLLQFWTPKTSTPSVVAVSINSSANVGIGTDAPSRPLHVYVTSGNNYLTVQNTSTSQSALQLMTGTTDANWVMYIPSSSTDLRLYRGADKVVFKADGNVGIGTNAPPHKLSIFGTGAGAATIQIEGEGGADPYINFLVNNTTHWAVGADDSASDSFKISQHSALGTNDRITITSGGNFGINVASPGYKLDVEESSANEIARIQGANSGSITFRNAASNVFRIYAGASDSLGFAAGNSFNADHLTINASGTITFNNAFTFPTADGSANQMLKTDGSGNLSWTSAGSGTVTGSGTDHYIPRWNGTTALQNSAIISLDSGSVGIGTNSPNDDLNIHDTSASANLGIKITRGTQTHGLRIGVNDSHAFVWTDQSQSLAFATNNTERLTILSGGSVGIGTNSPLSKLNVLGSQGNWRVDPDSVSNEIQVLSTTVANDGFRTFRLRTNETIIDTGGSERMRINSGGNVGIGTNAPVAKLTLPLEEENGFKIAFKAASGDGHAGLSTVDQSGAGLMVAANTYLNASGTPVAGNSSNPSLGIYFDGWSGDRMKFVTAASGNPAERMCINAAGKVIINDTATTNNNNAQLYVNGPVYGSEFDLPSGGVVDWANGDARIAEGLSSNYSLSLQNYDGSSAMVTTMFLKSGGNVGIGTVAPAAHLHVSKAAGTTTVLTQVAAGSTVGYEIKKTGSTTQHWKIVDGQTANGYLEIYDATDSATRMAFNTNGNVGIGTVNAGQLLTIKGDGKYFGAYASDGSLAALLGTDANGDGQLLLADVNGTTKVLLEAEASAPSYINNGGNFAIGTSSASRKLTVQGGSGDNLPARIIAGASTTTCALEFQDPDTTADYKVTMGSVGDNMFFQAGGSERVRIKSDGNVGIGTNNPVQRLHLQSPQCIVRVVSTTANSNSSIWFNSNVGGTNADRWEIGTNISAGSSLEIYDRLNGASRMVVKNDGNVGIGTNAPLDKLDVYGTGAIFRNLSDNADSVQIVRGTNHTASPDAKFYIYDDSSADWAAKIQMGGASYGLDIIGGVNYFINCRDASGNRLFEVHTSSVVINDGSTDMDFRVEGNGDDYLLFTEGSTDRVAISTTAPAAKLHVEGDFKVGTTNNGNWMGYKDVTLNGTTYTTALTINLANHTGCYVKLFLTGDWSSHSAVAFVGEYFVQNGGDGYAEPGTVISEFDNTNTDSIESKIVDPSSDTFTIQLKLSTAANGTLGGKLSYHVMGMATAVS